MQDECTWTIHSVCLLSPDSFMRVSSERNQATVKPVLQTDFSAKPVPGRDPGLEMRERVILSQESRSG